LAELSQTSGQPAEIADAFHRLYFERPTQTWQNTYWLGTPVRKCPLDLWIYQEIIFHTRPDLIIETGTRFGGSARFLADMCDSMGHGRVITIDIEKQEVPFHFRVTYLIGSSTDPEVRANVSRRIGPEDEVMVILDSDHSRDHVLSELRAYGPLVTAGNYLVVEDTNVNGNPVLPSHGPGPMEALQEYLAEVDSFVVDESMEKFLLSFNPRGFLRRATPA
jgi:cephalosporin hydroxylase